MYTPNCDVFWVGSYPHRDPMSASRKILRCEQFLLHWPQLPKRSAMERPIDQAFRALAGKKTPEASFKTGSATGWNAMWRLLRKSPRARKGHEHFKTQLVGPITLFGKIAAASFSGRSKEENEKALLQYLGLWLKHAYWQIDTIREKGFKPILVLDEPFLPTAMGAAGSTQARKTLKLLRSIVKRLRKRGARVGVHCCNRIAPAALTELEVDLIHFDAYHFPTQLSRSRGELQRFLKDGGVVAWGIVPVSESLTPMGETKLEKMFNDLLASMVTRGLPLQRVLAQSMVAPTCGTGSLTSEQSGKIVEFTARLSRQFKARHGLRRWNH